MESLATRVFFWAHNVIAELLALVCLVFIAYGLFTIIPKLDHLPMNFTRSIPGRSGKCLVKVNNSLDRRKVCAYGDDDHGCPYKSCHAAKNQNKKCFGPPEKSNAFKRIIDLPSIFSRYPISAYTTGFMKVFISDR